MLEHNRTSPLGVNLAYTKFVFLAPERNDPALHARLRAAAASIGRGFINDYEANGSRNGQAQDSVQFLTSLTSGGRDPAPAPYVLQVTSRYRPRLDETEAEIRRRVGEHVLVDAMDGAVRVPQYTSPEMQAYAYRDTPSRMSGRSRPTVVIIPIRKTEEWWRKGALERHGYFYPSVDPGSGAPVKGHAKAAEEGISTIYRRLYYNPDGHGRPGEYDFITYFECADDALPVFERVCRDLRDTTQNPEWKFVIEGPEWRGRRVLRW